MFYILHYKTLEDYLIFNHIFATILRATHLEANYSTSTSM